MAASQANRVIEQLRRALQVGEATVSDGQLLTCFVGQRDEAAFEALVRRHGPMVLGVCRRVLGNHHDAEDAFQAAFLVLARKAASIKSWETLANWLYGVAYNVARKARAMNFKRRARERQVAEMPEPEAARQENLGPDLQPLLDQELSRLPEKYRLPVVLCDLEGRPRKDVAGQLRIVEGTLSSRLTTARRLLAKRLARRGVVLTAGSLAAALSRSTASASLVSSTIKCAIAFVAGPAAAASLIPAQVVTLTEGTLKAMLMTKVKLSVAVFLTVGLVLAGTAAATRGFTAEPEGPRQSEKQAAGKTGDGPEPVRADNPTGKQRGGQTASDSKVRALLKERLALLRDMAKTLDEQHKAGSVALEEVQKANLRVHKAELDLCETDKERVAVHEKIVGVLKEMEKRVAELHKQAAVSQTDVIEAKVNRLEAEIALERAREKVATPAK